MENLFSKGITESLPKVRILSFRAEPSFMVKGSNFPTRFETAETALHTILEASPDLVKKLPAPERIIARRIRINMEGVK